MDTETTSHVSLETMEETQDQSKKAHIFRYS